MGFFCLVLSWTSLRQDDHIPYKVVWDEQDKSKSRKASPEILFIFSFLNICVISSLFWELRAGLGNRGLRVFFFCHFLVFSSFFASCFLPSVPPSSFFCSHCIFDDVVCIKSTNSPPGWCLFFFSFTIFSISLFPAFSVPVSSKPSSRVSIWVRGCHYMKMGGLCFFDALFIYHYHCLSFRRVAISLWWLRWIGSRGRLWWTLLGWVLRGRLTAKSVMSYVRTYTNQIFQDHIWLF